MYATVQERLTREIAEAILKAINPSGVGVVVEATYVSLCLFCSWKLCLENVLGCIKSMILYYISITLTHPSIADTAL